MPCNHTDHSPAIYFANLALIYMHIQQASCLTNKCHTLGLPLSDGTITQLHDITFRLQHAGDTTARLIREAKARSDEDR